MGIWEVEGGMGKEEGEERKLWLACKIHEKNEKNIMDSDIIAILCFLFFSSNSFRSFPLSRLCRASFSTE